MVKHNPTEQSLSDQKKEYPAPVTLFKDKEHNPLFDNAKEPPPMTLLLQKKQVLLGYSKQPSPHSKVLWVIIINKNSLKKTMPS
jgi:hypothetical protein